MSKNENSKPLEEKNIPVSYPLLTKEGNLSSISKEIKSENITYILSLTLSETYLLINIKPPDELLSYETKELFTYEAKLTISDIQKLGKFFSLYENLEDFRDLILEEINSNEIKIKIENEEMILEIVQIFNKNKEVGFIKLEQKKENLDDLLRRYLEENKSLKTEIIYLKNEIKRLEQKHDDEMRQFQEQNDILLDEIMVIKEDINRLSSRKIEENKKSSDENSNKIPVKFEILSDEKKQNEKLESTEEDKKREKKSKYNKNKEESLQKLSDNGIYKNKNFIESECKNKENENEKENEIEREKEKSKELNKPFNRTEINEVINNEADIEQNEQMIEQPKDENFSSDPKKLNNTIVISKKAVQNDKYCLFDSFQVNNQTYIVYGREDYGIDVYSLDQRKVIKNIKQAHSNNFYFCKHFQFGNDYFIVTSARDRSLKIWDFLKGMKNIITLKNVHNITIYRGLMYSHLIIKYNEKFYIISSATDRKIKVYNFQGDFIREFGECEGINSIQDYYDEQENKYYIIVSSYYVSVYDFNSGKLFGKYIDNESDDHYNATVIKRDSILQIVESGWDGYVRFWDFRKGNLIGKISTGKGIIGMTFWNENCLLTGCEDKTIKIIDLKKKAVVKSIKTEHTEFICKIQKVFDPIFGESVISHSKDGQILLHSNKNF